MTDIKKIVRRLEASRIARHRSPPPTRERLDFYGRLHGTMNAAMFVPHKLQYQAVLDELKPDDVVMDAGAGDFRFSLMASQKVKKVYAIEFCPETVWHALRIIEYELPENLIPVCANWDHFPVPEDVTAIVVLVNIGTTYLPTGWFRDDVRIIYGTYWEDGIFDLEIREQGTRPIEMPVMKGGL